MTATRLKAGAGPGDNAEGGLEGGPATPKPPPPGHPRAGAHGVVAVVGTQGLGSQSH